MYTENFKTLMKETEDNTNKWKKLCAHRLEKLILLKCLCHTKHLQIQRNPYQNSNGIFHRNKTNNPKICMKPQKTPNSQSDFKQEEQS